MTVPCNSVEPITLPVFFNSHCCNDESRGTDCHTNNANYNTNNDRDRISMSTSVLRHLSTSVLRLAYCTYKMYL